MSKCNCCGCHNHNDEEITSVNERHEHSRHEESKIKKGIFVIGVTAFICGLVFQFLNISLPSTIFYITGYLFIGFDIFCDLAVDFFHKEFFSENTLMVISSAGAMIIGQMAEGCAVLLLFIIGEVVEGRAQTKAEKNIEALLSLRPEKALLLVDGNECEVLPENLCVGDMVVVRAGDVIPCDGEIAEGCANIDTSSITGESVPSFCKEGANVNCGCISLDGVLKIRVTAAYSDNTFSKIITTLQSSNEKKSKSENFIRKFARIYTPTVILLAFIVAFLGSIITGEAVVWCYRALVFLASSCPCAFVISVPLVFFFGIGELSGKGFLVKGSEFIEKLSKITAIAFDKTGTITKGTLQVINFAKDESISEDELLSLALSLEIHSSHPIAKEIVRYTNEKNAVLLESTEIREIPGVGMSGVIGDKYVCIGNDRLLRGDIPFTADGKSTKVFILVNENVVGMFELLDEIREDTEDMLVKLTRLGVKKKFILTGDNKESANTIANELYVDEVYSELLPTDKAEILERIINENKNGVTAFVGDGINDAPVVALADVGIAMGNSCAGVTIESSDAVILKNSISVLADAIAMSRKIIKRVKFSILFAIIIKVTILLLSLFGLANMWIAVFGDVGVMVILVLNSMRKYR